MENVYTNLQFLIADKSSIMIVTVIFLEKSKTYKTILFSFYRRAF